MSESAAVPPLERPGEASTAAQEKETGRLEAFSDGVFAIAITLLILELRVPRAAPGLDLLQELAAEWPSFFAFITSFFTILIIWINHHRLFLLIRKVDRAFMVLNGLLLLTVTVVPFPTALVAEHLLGSNGTVAAAVYAGTGASIALGFNGVWRYAARGRRLLGGNATDAEVRTINRQYWVGPAAYGAAFALAFLSPVGAMVLCAALVVFYMMAR